MAGYWRIPSVALGAIVVGLLAVPASAPAVAKPGLRVSDSMIGEADGQARFVLRLSKPATKAIVVRYEMRLHRVSGWGASSESDFRAPYRAWARISRGKRKRVVHVPVIEDNHDEYDEMIGLYVDQARGTRLADRQGVTTVIDNDPEPALSIGDAAVVEGDDDNDGWTLARFPIVLSNPTGKFFDAQVEVSAVGNGSATPGFLYDFHAGTGVYSNPLSPPNNVYSVRISPDLADEGDETFRVYLHDPVAFTIADGEAIGTILDDDP